MTSILILTLGEPRVVHGWSLPVCDCFSSQILTAFHKAERLANILGKILSRFLLASNIGGTWFVGSLVGLGSCKIESILITIFQNMKIKLALS